MQFLFHLEYAHLPKRSSLWNVDEQIGGIQIQIIIPMSGFGERFRKAGYKSQK